MSTIEEVEKAVNESGTAIGNEHETYSLQQRIRDIITQRDYYQRQTDEARQRIACARGLLAPLGNQPIPSILAIREALNILR